MVEIDAGALEAFNLDAAALIVADCADVLGAQSEAGARHHRAGDLAAGAEEFFLKRDFAGVGRKVGNDEHGVGGVEADTDDVEFGHKNIVRGGRGEIRRDARFRIGAWLCS